MKYQISRENNFDLMRLIAALQVMLIHTISSWGVIGHFRWIEPFLMQFPGVPVFFAISGFLVTASYAAHRNNFWKYLYNRIIRIYPALWVCIAVGLILMYLQGVITEEVHFHNPMFYVWLLGQATMVQQVQASEVTNIFWGYEGRWNGSLWSISVEMQYYLMLPILFSLMALSQGVKKANYRILIFFLLSIAYFLFLISTKYASLFLPNYLYLFIFGIFFYVNKNTFFPYIRGKFWLWFGIYVAYFVVMSFLMNMYITPNAETFWGVIGMVLLCICAFAGAYTNPALSDRLLNRNDYSYGIYIYHVVVANALLSIEHKWGSMNYFLLSICLSLVAGVLSWHLVEKPVLNTFK